MDGVGMDDFDLQAVQPLKTKVFAAYHRLCNDFTTCTDRDKKTSMSERETERERERELSKVCGQAFNQWSNGRMPDLLLMPMLSCPVQDNMLSRRNMFLDRLEDAKRENKDKSAEGW